MQLMCAQRTIHPIECINDPFNILKSYQIFELQILHLIKELHVCVIYTVSRTVYIYQIHCVFLSQCAKKIVQIFVAKIRPAKIRTVLIVAAKIRTAKIQTYLEKSNKAPHIYYFIYYKLQLS